MKAFTALILTCMIFVSIFASAVAADNAPVVGVKKGDWIEYDVNMTGSTPSVRNMTSYKLEILTVEGTAFEANVTARYTNGTVSSAVWQFNFTEGQEQGWLIIPANLSAGDTFYDASKPGNVTIEGQEQKAVAGANRTVTHASDAKRLVKEWDMATGVYVYALECPKNFTIITTATATNMWSPQSQETDQTLFFMLVAVGTALVGVALVLGMVATKRKGLKLPAVRRLSEGKIAALTIILVVLAEVAITLFFPFDTVGISFAQFNLIMQTLWITVVLTSMWFRMKGNYFVHEILMLIVMCAWLVSFSAVLMMDPLSSNPVLANTPLRLVMNGLHAVFSVPALVVGLWLVVLWRPQSTVFPAKSRRIAQLIPVFWVPSYVVGVLDFLVLHTTFFG